MYIGARSKAVMFAARIFLEKKDVQTVVWFKTRTPQFCSVTVKFLIGLKTSIEEFTATRITKPVSMVMTGIISPAMETSRSRELIGSLFSPQEYP